MMFAGASMIPDWSEEARREKLVRFENIPLADNGGADVPQHYRGLVWTDFGVLDPSIAYPDAPTSGYFTGLTSGHQVAYSKVYDDAPDAESAIRVDFNGVGTFTMKSANLTAAWDSSLKVTVLGIVYVNQVATVAYSKTVTINDRGPTHVDLDFRNVNAIFFAHSDPVHDRHQDFYGDNIVLDDCVFANIVRAPAGASHAFASATLGHGLAGDAVLAPHFDLAHAGAIA